MRLSSRRPRVLVAAFLVFVFTIALRATAASGADAVLTLNTIPVVMIAFGRQRSNASGLHVSCTTWSPTVSAS